MAISSEKTLEKIKMNRAPVPGCVSYICEGAANGDQFLIVRVPPKGDQFLDIVAGPDQLNRTSTLDPDHQALDTKHQTLDTTPEHKTLNPRN